ncbi:TolC family protein [Telmatobacter sp. DSM 110680]|uniref:TolC family protein n=1 Tax=Telmatobacter sp. DSM 110680 TaxID=3036704 RepID=A0AAU7DF37_9BACT
MQLFGRRVFEDQNSAGRAVKRNAGQQLRAITAAMLTLTAGVPSGIAQQQSGGVTGAGAKQPEKQSSQLPTAPAPVPTKPLDLRPTNRDYSKPFGPLLGNPINMYRPTSIGKASFANSVRLDNLVKDGKIYLSLSDAIALAIENNYDIAIARYDLDIADTDILRTKTGAEPLGAPSGLVTGTLGGSVSILSTGGGPGGTTVGSGGAGSGVSGLTLTTAGAGPLPEPLDPNITGTVQFERARQPQANTLFSGGKTALTTNTNQYNFGYNQGFVTGTALQANITNTRITSDNPFTAYSPELSSVFKATVTQHLLQGAGIWINKRFMYQAINDRRITDSSFRQQILYTVNQVESIYWGLVSAYEDVQAKQRALDQSTKLSSDTHKQLEIGTMAPLDVVQADSTVSTDKQALTASQNTLNYQQQIIKQAIARNLNDPALATAPVVPTDRISLDQIPEETQPVEDLVQAAFKNRPELEQASLTLRNDEITLKGARNQLLPALDVYGFYGSSALGGSQSPNWTNFQTGEPNPPGTIPSSGYGTVLTNLFNSSAPDKGVGFSMTIPIRNRSAQAQQERSLMEYRQAELRLAQLYTQIRMQVVNAQFALTNDRAEVQSSLAARDYAQQSLDAEQKKLKLGASTTANVLQQERNLAIAENNLIAANAAFANNRAGLYQVLATTLEHYGINLVDAAKGTVNTAPTVPGVQPASAQPTTTPTPMPAQPTDQPTAQPTTPPPPPSR